MDKKHNARLALDLKKARKQADDHAKSLKGYDLMRFLEWQIEEIQYAMDMWYADDEPDSPSGPEATRDEVGFARSPQRDCRTERVAPARL